MLEQEWHNILADDLDKLSQVINPVNEKTVKLEEGENRIVSIFFLDIRGRKQNCFNLLPRHKRFYIDK